jgi:hypothetical protein
MKRVFHWKLESEREPQMSKRQNEVVGLLKTVENGGTGALQFVNPNKYIQHNLAWVAPKSGLESRRSPKGLIRHGRILAHQAFRLQVGP